MEGRKHQDGISKGKGQKMNWKLKAGKQRTASCSQGQDRTEYEGDFNHCLGNRSEGQPEYY